MGELMYLALLSLFYALIFVFYSALTAAQVVLKTSDGSSAAAGFSLGFIMKLFVRLALGVIFFMPVVKVAGRVVGLNLSKRSESRREMLKERVFSLAESETRAKSKEPQLDSTQSKGQEASDKKDSLEDWRGIVGFFHPFCNAGGGGERVLWAAIKATQDKYPNAICVVYTGDHDVTKSQIVSRVKARFNIELNSPKLFFLYLSTRKYVLSSTWPRFTLLGQSLGSVLLALDAFQLLVPDVFIDTMGYAFALGCARLLFPKLPTAAYVHYPTISTDMLGSLNAEEEHGLNAGAGRGWKGALKKQYWELFAWAYGHVGGTIDVVMANSSWTCDHITALWDASRKSNGKTSEVSVVFPPCAVEELEETIPVDEKSESKRENTLVYIAQFRPEKNHQLILEAFAEYMHPSSGSARPKKDAKLVLIGSVRDSEDAKRVYELRLLVHELKIRDSVEFACDASWPEILQRLQTCSVGVNGMWNEHFGIGVVEYEAAGLISVVNNSGGPKRDIVIEIDGQPTGYHASTASEYAAAFGKALSLSPKEKIAMRLRARESAKRFSEGVFTEKWNERAEEILRLQVSGRSAPLLGADGLMISASYIIVLLYDLYSLIRQA